MSSFLGRALRGARDASRRRPLLFNAAAVAGLFAAGDVLSQRIEARDKGTAAAHDWARTARMAAAGAAVGPLEAAWYRYLDGAVRRRVASVAAVVGAKVLADQFVFTPPFLVAEFSVLSTLEGMGPAETAAHLAKTLPGFFVHDCMFWMPVQVLNFRFVPVPSQAIVVNTCAVVWNAYLSHVQHRPRIPAVAAPPQEAAVAAARPSAR